MDWRGMPPMAGLRAFAAFAEHRNVVRAGAALNVSHAAVSQQLRSLESDLDVPLFRRTGRQLQLTDEGETLAQAVLLGFGAIENALREISLRGAARPLHISCTPMFATHWLMPRLSEFRLTNPDIDLVLDPRGEVVDLTAGGIDLAIRYGAGRWPGLEAEALLISPMVVIAAADLLGKRRVRSPQELLDFPWLEELGTTEAAHWLRSRGVADALRGARTFLPGNLLMQAVRQGQGVAVSVRDFVAEDLEAGRLVELFCEDDARGYHIVTRPGVQRPQLRAFVTWLRRQKSLTQGEASEP